MRVIVQITIDEEVNPFGLSLEDMVDEAIKSIAECYNYYGLDYDIGYNPQTIVKGKLN